MHPRWEWNWKVGKHVRLKRRDSKTEVLENRITDKIGYHIPTPMRMYFYDNTTILISS